MVSKLTVFLFFLDLVLDIDGEITIPLLVVDFLLNFSCSLSGYPSCQKFSPTHPQGLFCSRSVDSSLCHTCCSRLILFIYFFLLS